ncbi:MAG: DUF2851 family protein [Cytophagales bacterium]|nr:DUF2851 family protein [Cytophagales bacterium]
MQESFLYYVWQFQYFDKKNLTTCQEEALNILHPGMLNAHRGPDFVNANLIINNIAWYGHIEIHVNASDWYHHQHQEDPVYDNVILHVVWNNDRVIRRRDGSILPTLALKNSVSPTLITRYKQLLVNKSPIPCAHQLSTVSEVVKISMLDRALFQRLTQKNSLVYQLLENNKNDWEETVYQLLAYNFGFKVNSEPMLALSLSLPLKIVARQRYHLTQLEALFLGQAGFLKKKATRKDNYFVLLSKEYQYLTHKYKLAASKVTEAQWKFFRLRPANFPTIRIAQFTQLLHQHQSIFHLLVKSPYKTLYQALAVRQSAYWQKHYQFAKKSNANIPRIGKVSIENILINTVVPVLIAYGKSNDEQNYIDKAVEILQQLPPEDNKITRYWADVGIKVQSAFDSQALIEIFNNFCSKKKCLSCNIGVALMKKN